METFEHERFPVYRASIEFLIVADDVAGALTRGRKHLSDQLQRAATSISFNIAEGAGEYSKPEKIRFYRIARRSATECAAILDACSALSLVDVGAYQTGRSLLLSVVVQLTAMIKKVLEQEEAEG
jgi:four helix bundle protein